MPSLPGWENHEREVAAMLGLERTITSGNKWHDPGDATTRGREHPFPIYMEGKYTEGMSFSLNMKSLKDYANRAAQAGMRMVLPVRFWPRGRHAPDDYVVVSLNDFVELYEKAYPRDV
jgi:hypothetical protein